MTSEMTSVVSEIRSREYSQETLHFEFRSIKVNEEERLMYFLKMYEEDSMKPNKLKRHLKMLHSVYANKDREFFEYNLKQISKNRFLK